MTTDPFRPAGTEPYPPAPMEPFSPATPEPFTSETTYHQQAAGSLSDVTSGKTVILKVNGRFGRDELAAGGTLGTTTDVTVVP